MGVAKVISFAEVRASKQWDTLRQQLHERFDQWLDTLEQQWHEPPSTVSEGSATVWDVRQQRTGGITETMVTQVHAGEPQRTRAKRARGQWRDAKGLRVYRLDGERIVHVRSGHHVQNDEQRSEALQQSKEAGGIAEKPVRLCVVCDGAEWRGQHVQALFPQARQVLDDDHGAQALHRVAKAHYGASVQAVEWVEAPMTRLALGTVGVGVGGVRRRQAQSDEAAKAMANCWDSLDEHRGRPTSRQFRRGGSPLGSGGIASSNTCIGHVRLKRSGAWWCEANSNHMFALRCAKYNGTLDQVFVRYQQRLRATSE